MAAAAAEAAALGARFTLAHLTGAEDPVLARLREAGVALLDLAAPLAAVAPERRWNAAKHPSAAVHARYAELLAPVLASAIPG